MSTRPALILAALAICWVAAAAEPVATLPVVSVPQIQEAPKLDGDLSDPAWEHAATLSDPVLAGNSGIPRYRTEVRVMFDARNLYVGARMYSRNASALRAQATERDGPVEVDDAFSLLIDTAATRQAFAQLTVNPINTRYDAYAGDPRENFTWESATRILPDGWSVEIALPFRNTIAPQPGEKWAFNAFRNAPGEGEKSAWLVNARGIVDPQALGDIIFGSASIGCRIDDLGQLWLGQNNAVLTASDFREATPAAPSEKLKANVRVNGRDRYGNYFGFESISVAPGSSQQFSIPYRIPQDGAGTVTFSVTDQQGRTVWRSAGYPYSTPRVMEPLEKSLEQITAALRMLPKIPEGQPKQQYKQSLNDLSERWQYLDKLYQRRGDLVRPQALGMQMEAERLLQDATAVKQQMGK